MTEVIEKCQECGDSVMPGSGKFVNRVPADNGFICAECCCYDCDACDKVIGFDEDVPGKDGEGHYHVECVEV